MARVNSESTAYAPFLQLAAISLWDAVHDYSGRFSTLGKWICRLFATLLHSMLLHVLKKRSHFASI